jgi:NAD(P)-dependent dehydrogenase (short-subunit alcohol dehydrogenase family)
VSAAGRAALVLGGSGGIGLAVAELLREEGYALTLQGRRDERVASAAERVGGEALAFPCDLRDEDAIRALVAAHAERHGRLDALVNSAGVGIGQPLEEVAGRYLDRQLDLNVRAMVLATSECVPLLRAAGEEHGKAVIVNVASWAGLHGQAWLSVYSATKAAVIRFSDASQRELAGAGVQVTALCPATVDTEMTRYAHNRIRPEEMLSPRDVAEAVRLLLRTSPQCVIPEIVLGRRGDLVVSESRGP